MAKEIAEEYASSLADLTVNSKPLINMLTILAEENIDHAGTIVETVEKHLEKVNPDVKLPVLYLVDSIIKNVGGAYIQKFSHSIVNMFTRTFKQVDEKIRSQMFKLRETWHDVFPATKMYQLDVKVNLMDPAWPIQAHPQQANIHVNPNFLKKPATSTATPAVPPEEDEKMRSMLAKKEKELLLLQKKKVEMELEQVRRQLELENATKKQLAPKPLPPVAMPIALVNPVAPLPAEIPPTVSIKQRLGLPVGKVGGRIAPVSAAMLSARRDPRLARHAPALAPAPAPAPTTGTSPAPIAPVASAAPAPIAPNVFDIKPLERFTKRKNVITIDVRPETRDPRRRDPRLERRRETRKEKPKDRLPLGYVDKIADPRKISKLPPIPKINREKEPRKKEIRERRRRPEREPKEDSSGSSPEKKVRPKRKLKPVEEPAESEVVHFKELKNYHKERYMRRNRDKSESPERAEPPASAPAAPEPDPNVPEVPPILENKDVDLRVLPAVDPKAAVVAQKRPSTETLEGKTKKNKVDKFDILFGNEDVDLRQLPQVDEVVPPPPTLNESPKRQSPKPKKDKESTPPKPMSEDEAPMSPKGSPKKDWHEVKEKSEGTKKTPSKLDLVRAKLAEATKGKDRLGRPLLFSKSPSLEKERERRRTISFEDTDMRNESGDDFDAEDNKKTISIIMSQAKEQLNEGQLDKTQYNALMYQVFQLNEKLKLKEAKQRESLEVSKLKLKEAKQKNKEALEASKKKFKAHVDGENKVASPKSSPNNFGDIDERIVPAAFLDTPPDSQGFAQDSDMRTRIEHGIQPLPGPPMPNMPMFNMNGPFMERPIWRGPRARVEEFGPRRFRGPVPPFFRGQTRLPRPPFERLPLPLPTPKMGICQGECPLQPYERSESPPPLGAPGFFIPATDYSIIDYIDQDPVKTIQIDGIPREIRFYGDTAVIMLDWDDPREIKFLPGCRRVTFDNKDSVVISFNEGYKKVEIDDQVFDIKFGAPTRELYINGRWHECFFGGNPLGVIIDGKPRLVHLEGPLPQVDIGKEKRMDLVAGKINLIVNATQMCPVYLDAKVQKFTVDNQVYTIRFVDALRTVLINEQPFKVEYGDLPKPIFIGNGKHFIRFSALPRNVKPGFVQIANMEGSGIPTVPNFPMKVDGPMVEPMDVEPAMRPAKTPSPDANNENQGLDMLASVMPSTMEFASGSDYSVAEPLFPKSEKIPGLETPVAEKPPPINLPGLGNINVTDLFAKLVATGIVQQAPKETKEDKVEEKKPPKEDSTKIHKVDLLRPQTLRGKQPGVVTRLYGGMQCSGCGSRFPPEQTVRYSQHLDWHFRQNRRERDSARRAHSRHWHYDLADWLQYEEIDELDEREKNWFETSNAEEGETTAEVALEPPSVPAGAPADCVCALCGDRFHQYYDEEKEEWHLRNSVRHDDNNYHPMCFKDYKASLAKEEEEQKNLELLTETDEVKDAPIEIRDVDETLDQSDNESVVEVLEDDDKQEEPLEIYDAEIDDGDEDDVIYKAEPVEQVLVEDDADTDDETAERRAARDRLAEIDFNNVKVKQEPIDPDDEPIITAEEESVKLTPEPPSTMHTSIDGNSQFEAAPAPAPQAIRINISKAPVLSGPIIPVISTRNSMLEDISTETDEEPLPPGEELELQYSLKPSLQGVRLSRTPPEKKGVEESGLCSIM